MPIGVFKGPHVGNETYNSLVSEAYYALLQEAGVNFFSGAETYDATVIDQILTITDKLGMNYIVWDEIIGSGHDYVNETHFRERIALYKSHPSFAGLYCKDEPIYSDFSNISKIQKLVDRYFKDKICYSNLYPLWGTATSGSSIYTGDTAMLYTKYVQDFIKTVNPKYISFDYYPFGQGIGNVEAGQGDWFENLAIMRKLADDAGIPFWTYIQAGGGWAEGNQYTTRVANKEEFNWNINTALAYGTKGLSYFPGCHNLDEGFVDCENGTMGLLDKNGAKTKYWDYSKEITAHISAIDGVLMNARNLGIMASGSSPMEISDRYITIFDSFRELKSISGNVLVGCFDYQGKTALYVVNNDLYNYTEPTLTFDNCYGYTVIQKGVASDVIGNSITLTNFTAGEGVLIVLK